MGVYIFRSLGGEWIKVGHYICRGKRPFDNPWYRITRRGFHSVCAPPSLRNGGLDAVAFALVAWYPNLGTKEERAIHRAFGAGSYGEFHLARDEEAVRQMAWELGGTDTPVDDASREAAFRWARKYQSIPIKNITSEPNDTAYYMGVCNRPLDHSSLPWARASSF